MQDTKSQETPIKNTTRTKLMVLLIALPLALLIVSLFVGRLELSPLDVIKVLLSKLYPIEQTWSGQVETVVMSVRLPRAILALLVGCSLSVAGTCFQGMFRNPLVSPDILGVCAGAGFGAALAILLSVDSTMIQLSAVAFGILGVAFAYLLSRVYKSTSIIMLLLSGIVVSAFFSALIGLTKCVADPQQKLPAITFWLMGSLASSTMRDLISVFIPILVGTFGLFAIRWRINVLSLGEEESRSLGINTKVLITVIVLLATVITSVAVSVSGIIGWVGLMVPHLGRMLVGPDHKYLIPASAVIGASYLLVMDDLARTIATAEIPLGILTAIIGAPFFAYLVQRTRGRWL